MEFACFTDWSQLPDDAEQLFLRGETQSLFLSRRWFESIAGSTFEKGQHLLLACVVDRGNALALLPLRTDGAGSCAALGSYYTSLFSILVSEGDRPDVLDCMADGLAGLSFQSFRLEPIAGDDTAISQLQRAMEKRGFEGNRFFHFVNWSHQLMGQTADEYLAGLPSRLRNTIARKRRKLVREQGYEIRLFEPADLPQAIVDYNRVYKASWKGGERFAGFVPALLGTTAEAGWLRLAILYIAGQPAAAQIWFVVHGNASIFRLAYDERWERYSPGSILTAHLMKQVIDDDRVESIDFLTGNERYKQDWMSERKERWRLVLTQTASNRSKQGLLARLFKWNSQ